MCRSASGERERILVVQGSGFNWPEPDHFRLVFLPTEEVLGEALDGMTDFLSWYRQGDTESRA